MTFVDDLGEIRESTNGVFLRTPYNYDMDAASDKHGLRCEDVTRAQQQFKEECDINTIVERFGLTGQLPDNVSTPVNADFDEIVDYQSALNMLIAADEAFMQYPAHIREQFGNDAGKFVDFVSDPANIDKAREWGLAHAKKVEVVPEPMLVRVVPDEGK